MTTLEQLAAARDAVGNVDYPQRSLYSNWKSLRYLYAAREQEANRLLTNHHGPDPLAPHESNAAHGLRAGLAEFVTLKNALDLLESMPEFKQAHATIQPLMDEVRRLEDQLQAEGAVYAEKLHAINAAEEAALDEARAALAKDPAILKLHKQAEAVRPPHLEPVQMFRGRVQLTGTPD